MVTIENQYLRVQIAALGAELQTVFSKEWQLEYIWQADPAFWGKHSPVLFPVVGTLKNNSYTFAGKEYHLDRHGFARGMEFKPEKQASDSAQFLLESNAATRALFPFDFRFRIRYSIDQRELTTRYEIENPSSEIIYFSVGGHPAFKVPLEPGLLYEDYYLLFDRPEQLERWPISKEGLIDKEPQAVVLDGQKLHLSRRLFANDALVFKQVNSDKIGLRTDKSEHGLSFSITGFPYLGIWAAKNADFVCIEPWCGIADSVDANQQLTAKEGILSLAPGAIFVREWKIRLF